MFWPKKKKLFDAKGPFGDFVIKNPARHFLAFSLRVMNMSRPWRILTTDYSGIPFAWRLGNLS